MADGKLYGHSFIGVRSRSLLAAVSYSTGKSLFKITPNFLPGHWPFRDGTIAAFNIGIEDYPGKPLLIRQIYLPKAADVKKILGVSKELENDIIKVLGSVSECPEGKMIEWLTPAKKKKIEQGLTPEVLWSAARKLWHYSESCSENIPVKVLYTEDQPAAGVLIGIKRNDLEKAKGKGFISSFMYD